LAFSKLDKYFKDFYCQLMFAEWLVKITASVLQLQVRGGIRSRNLSACTGVENEANI
jgi:hypothetical protein